MRRLIAIAMCLISLIAVLSACGGKGSNTPPATDPSADPAPTTVPAATQPATQPTAVQEPDIVGTWEASLDYAGSLNTQLGSDPNMGEHIHFHDNIFKLVYRFGGDGTYTVSADTQSVEDCYSDIVAQFMDCMQAYLAANGTELSALLEETGMTAEACADQMMIKETFLSFLADLEDTGEYTWDNDTLTMGGKSYTCQFSSASELTLNTGEDPDEPVIPFPMTLVKK